jgi:hypothetical protein
MSFSSSVRDGVTSVASLLLVGSTWSFLCRLGSFCLALILCRFARMSRHGFEIIPLIATFHHYTLVSLRPRRMGGTRVRWRFASSETVGSPERRVSSLSALRFSTSHCKNSTPLFFADST